MQITLLGTGLMGSAAAERLADQGQLVIAWNRHFEQAQQRLPKTVRIEANLALAVDASPAILLFLSDAAAIHAVLDALPDDALQGKTIIQMGTISPQESRDLAHKLEQTGTHYLEAPVLGSLPEARKGELLIMVGGNKEDFELQLPLLKLLGTEPRLIGPVGQAAALKLALNQLIAGLTASFALSLKFAQKEGVDVNELMQILRESALYAPTFDKKLGKMLEANYQNPNFPLKHLDKDIGLFLESAEPYQLRTGMLQAIQAIVSRGLAEGNADLDYSALFESV